LVNNLVDNKYRLNMSKYKTTIILLIVGLLIGVLFATQFKVPSRIDTPVASVSALKDSKTVLDDDQASLTKQISDTRELINNKQNELKANQRISNDLVDQVQDLRNKAGLSELKDNGVVITLADSQSGEATIDSIVHASDIRDLVNVLWQSGATAISVNDQRLVFSSSIDSIVNTVLVNNTKVTNPFVIKAIGDTKELTRSLNDSVNLKDIKDRQKSNHLVFNVATSQVTISSYSGGFSINNATTKE
jgi:uncharacterized protein YlxW (UPF0749 family)